MRWHSQHRPLLMKCMGKARKLWYQLERWRQLVLFFLTILPPWFGRRQSQITFTRWRNTTKTDPRSVILYFRWSRGFHPFHVIEKKMRFLNFVHLFASYSCENGVFEFCCKNEFCMELIDFVSVVSFQFLMVYSKVPEAFHSKLLQHLSKLRVYPKESTFCPSLAKTFWENW